MLTGMPVPPNLDPPRHNWFLLLLRGYRFPTGMLWSMLTLGSFSALLCFLQFRQETFTIKIPLTLHGIFGFVVSLLLVFRTNSAYERWWEGRKQLGTLNDGCRYLANRLRSYARLDRDQCHTLASWLCAYVWSVKEHLRGPDYEFSSTLVPLEHRARYARSLHKPLFLLNRLADFVTDVHAQGKLSEGQLRAVDDAMKAVTDVLGGTERIKTTPIPMAYTLHLRRIIMVYVATLPFGLIYDYNWWSVPIVMVVFYVMAGIEFIGEEIEEPFGRDENDLPVSQIAARISAGVAAVLEVPNPSEGHASLASGALRLSDFVPAGE
ncbi:MAG: bestrophin family protein [Candidatus Eremiobacterota bacterium]